MAVTVGQLAAGAAGGPAAATDFAQAAAGDQRLANQATAQLAAASGKMDAPAAFTAAQAPGIAMPAKAGAAAAKSGGGGAAAASGDVSSAVANYRNAVNAVKPLMQQVMQASTLNPYSGVVAQTAQNMLQQGYETQRYQAGMQQYQNQASVQQTLNRAAASGMNPQTYGILKDVVGAAKSAPEALELLNQRVQQGPDGAYYLTDPHTGKVITDPDTGTQLTMSNGDVGQLTASMLPAYGINPEAIRPGVQPSDSGVALGGPVMPALGDIYGVNE